MLKEAVMKRSIALLSMAFALFLFVSLPGTPLSLASGAQAAPAYGMQMGMQKMDEMSKMHEKTMAEMKTSHNHLDELAKRMNAATGDAKIAAMAEVVNELVRQHRAMDEAMAKMDQMMMGQMRMMMK
jgi:hypothetical protein